MLCAGESDACTVFESHSAADFMSHTEHICINMLGNRFTTVVLLRGRFGTEGIVCYGFNLGFKF